MEFSLEAAYEVSHQRRECIVSGYYTGRTKSVKE